MKKRVTKGRIAAILVFLVVLSLASVDITGAWFVDTGTWVSSTYSIGVIDYSLKLNSTKINVIRLAQEVEVVLPIIGGVKINDTNAISSFNNGVTLADFNIYNIGDFAINLNIAFDFTGLFNNDILCLVLPQNAVVDSEKKTITILGNTLSYRDYIISKIGAENLAQYATYRSKLEQNSENVDAKLITNIGIYNEISNTPYSSIKILLWAEYDQMPFSPAAIEKTNDLIKRPIYSEKGKLVMTISAAPPEN